MLLDYSQFRGANWFVREVKGLWQMFERLMSTNLSSGNKVVLARVLTLPGHPNKVADGPFDSVNSISFSPDGKMLATTGYADSSLKVWNLETGALLAVKSLRERPVGVAFTADSLQIICFTLGHEVCFYQLGMAEDMPVEVFPLFGARGEGERSGPDPYHYGFVAANLNYDQSLAVLTSHNRASIIWDVIERRPVKTFVLPRGRAAAFSPDGSQLAIGESSSFQVFDMKTGTSQLCLISQGQPTQLWSLRISPKGNFLGTVHNDRTITIWDARKLHELHNFFISGSAVYDCAFSRDDSLFATAHPDRGLVLWEPKQAEQVCLYAAVGVELVAFSPSVDQIAISFNDGRIELLSYKMAGIEN